MGERYDKVQAFEEGLSNWAKGVEVAFKAHGTAEMLASDVTHYLEPGETWYFEVTAPTMLHGFPIASYTIRIFSAGK